MGLYHRIAHIAAEHDNDQKQQHPLPVIGENVPDLLAEFHGAQLCRLRIMPFFDLLPEGQSVAADHSTSCSFPSSSGSRTYFRKTPVMK